MTRTKEYQKEQNRALAPKEKMSSEIQKTTRARYITGTSEKYRWAYGMTQREFGYWRLFWLFLAGTAMLSIGFGIWISVYFNLIEYGWWLPVLLTIILWLVLTGLTVGFFYTHLIDWLESRSDMNGKG